MTAYGNTVDAGTGLSTPGMMVRWRELPTRRRRLPTVASALVGVGLVAVLARADDQGSDPPGISGGDPVL